MTTANETCSCTVARMFRDGVCQGCGLPALPESPAAPPLALPDTLTTLQAELKALAEKVVAAKAEAQQVANDREKSDEEYDRACAMVLWHARRLGFACEPARILALVEYVAPLIEAQAKLTGIREAAYWAGFLDGAGGSPSGHPSDFGDAGYERLCAHADARAAKYADERSTPEAP